jgi:hypothetical protein
VTETLGQHRARGREYYRRDRVVKRLYGDGYIDQEAVSWALEGRCDPTKLTHQEITAAVLLGHQRGMSDPQIGAVLRMTDDAVLKRRHRAREKAA